MKTVLNTLKRYGWVAEASFIFGLFFYISSKSPLAGDDWGYALNGLNNNPFTQMVTFYMTWSGRLLSELYGFLMAPQHDLWVLLNPLLFTTIFISLVSLTRSKKPWLAAMVLLSLMISVKDELRMETYTWLMGTTYVIPLALMSLYLRFIKHWVIDMHRVSIWRKAMWLVGVFAAGLFMENASILMVLIGMVLVFDSYRTLKKVDPWKLGLLASSSLALIILRLSPGAASRLNRDHSAWLKLSIIDQLTQNYPNFIRFTFIEHRYLILVLSATLLALLVTQRKVSTSLKALLSGVLVLGMISSLSLTLSTHIESDLWLLFTDVQSLFNLTFWVFYILTVYLVLWFHVDEPQRDLVLILVTLAGLSNGVMMLSPIFGFRSSLYTVYLLIAVVAISIQELKSQWLIRFLAIGLVALTFKSTYSWIVKYQEVSKIDAIRQEQIQYYIDHPNEKEAWLIRYPIYSIHAGDIEPDDTYHMDVFKQYYGLASDVQLYFYFPE